MSASCLDLTAIVLTFNEERHIERCLASLKGIAAQVVVVDCYSQDNTVEIARRLGARVHQHPWVNYASQFNWALEELPIDTAWILRLDADEVLTAELRDELKERLAGLPEEVTGIYVKRRMVFMERWIRHGDMYPVRMLRLWRTGAGFCEKRWMDEHIKVTRGSTVTFAGDIVDHNLNHLTWWIGKHNGYASREAVDLLNIRYNLARCEEVEPRLFGTQEQKKRWLKLRYARLPFFVRPFVYFLYRYLLRLGFLDGGEGLVWHFLQGFWYRFLVDAKLYEINKKCGNDPARIVALLKSDYGIDIS